MNKENLVDELLGSSHDKQYVPQYPGRIFWRNDQFFGGFPHAPVVCVEVRFREATATEEGDFTIYEARWIDTSNPEDSHGEWRRENR